MYKVLRKRKEERSLSKERHLLANGRELIFKVGFPNV
jgi:hypothetical protein